MGLLFLSIAAFFGINISQRNAGSFQRAITIGIAISILLMWSGNMYAKVAVLFIQLLFGLLTGYYAIMKPVAHWLMRFSIISMGLFIALVRFFQFYHLQGIEVLVFIAIIPLFLFFYCFKFKKEKQQKELGFMLIWTAILVYNLAIYFIQDII